MGQFRDALDKQFPPKTDEQRAAYYAGRRHLHGCTPLWQWFVVVVMLVISFSYCASALAGPVIVAPLSAAAAVAQRNNQSEQRAPTWSEGPCKGQRVASCTPLIKKAQTK